MSATHFLPFNQQPSNQFNTNNQPNLDPQQQHFNLLLRAFLLMKANNDDTNGPEMRSQPQIPSISQYLTQILTPILQGNQAIPIQLKILIDQLIEHLNVEDVQKVLQGSDWSLEDLRRGYVLMDKLSGQPPLVYNIVNIQTQIAIFQMVSAIFPKLRVGIDSLRHSLLQSLIVGQNNQNSQINQGPVLEQQKQVEESMNDNSNTDVEESSEPTPSTTPAPSLTASCSFLSGSSPISEERESNAEMPISVDSTQATSPTQRQFKSTKRRVRCDKCLRSFCDKGALKIHNSAVHLKETHVCTVHGCNRVFSSRRSRNRHSGNPNLHTSLNLHKSSNSSSLSSTQLSRIQTPIEQSLNCTIPSFLPPKSNAGSTMLSILSQLPLVSGHLENGDNANEKDANGLVKMDTQPILQNLNF